MRAPAAIVAVTTAAVFVTAAPADNARQAASCDGTRMSLVRDFVGPRGTGVAAATLQLRNRSAAPCLLARRPRLTLVDRSGAMPFVIRYVRRCVLFCGRMRGATPTRPVLVEPGRSVYVSFDSYRCDLGTRRTATGARLVVGSQRLAVKLPADRPDFDWCGPGDPGSILNVSPFESTPRLAAQRA